MDYLFRALRLGGTLVSAASLAVGAVTQTVEPFMVAWAAFITA
jgi:hypothetical protein